MTPEEIYLAETGLRDVLLGKRIEALEDTVFRADAHISRLMRYIAELEAKLNARR